MTRSTKNFIQGLPKGTFYVLSREGHGFGFSGDTAVQAKALTKANFDRVKARSKSSSKPLGA